MGTDGICFIAQRITFIINTQVTSTMIEDGVNEGQFIGLSGSFQAMDKT